MSANDFKHIIKTTYFKSRPLNGGSVMERLGMITIGQAPASLLNLESEQMKKLELQE